MRLPVLLWIVVLVGGDGSFTSATRAADPFEEINQRFQQQQREGDDAVRGVREQYRAKRAAMEAEWQKKEQEIEARWQRAKREIEKKWDQAVRSTRKEWVDYSPTFDARSIVNFEEGAIEVAALVPLRKSGAPRKSDQTERGSARRKNEAAPADDLALRQAAAAEIARQMERIFSEQDELGRAILNGQVVSRTGMPVNQRTVKPFIQQEVLPAVVVDEKPVDSRDGIQRAKVTATVKMTPDHLKRRAHQYLDVVLAHAQRHRVDPRLVLAVIHTESYFNPRAQSSAPAYGLMQLVPRAGARDAYNFLYQDDKVLDPDYLYDPARNVELGVAYLNILMRQSFADLDEGERKNYLVICAYNWGPANIRNKIMNRIRVQSLPESRVFDLLTERTPEETRQYLKRVTERRALYTELVGR
ncbi:MAG: transglycosylase SLT domain-containing protein [Nitrospirae bacterium]|nr:transglycosylase SLT domain-containing protein [Nitrospirota bacterium]